MYRAYVYTWSVYATMRSFSHNSTSYPARQRLRNLLQASSKSSPLYLISVGYVMTKYVPNLIIYKLLVFSVICKHIATYLKTIHDTLLGNVGRMLAGVRAVGGGLSEQAQATPAPEPLRRRRSGRGGGGARRTSLLRVLRTLGVGAFSVCCMTEQVWLLLFRCKYLSLPFFF